MEDLRTRCPYFFEVALRLAALQPFEGLGKFVTTCFRARYRARPTATYNYSLPS